MSRVKKTIVNARVNLIFYSINLFLSFYSRKIFLTTLGASFLGLTATISNILGFLNLSELGVGTAITYLLYQPLSTKNNEKTREIISFLGYYYKKIGLSILALGVVVSFFIPFIFEKSNLPNGILLTAFFTYLFSVVTEYYFNYKQLILNADQKNYLTVASVGSANIVKIIFQIVALTYFENKIYIFLSLEVLFVFIRLFIIRKVIKTNYNWLESSEEIELTSEVNTEVKTTTKLIFKHQVASYILDQTDQILIFAFTSLNMVTYYSNYTMLLSRGVSLIDQFFNSTKASIGNLVTSEDEIKIKRIFDEIVVLRYFISGVIIYGAYLFIPSFIQIWIGKKYLLNEDIFLLILVNGYISMTRQPVDAFLTAFGIFKDTWAPWTEAILNLIISLIVGYYYGIIGVLLGTSISMFLIVVLWKPYLLFSSGFFLSVSNYWKLIFKISISLLLSFLFCNYTFSRFDYFFVKNSYFNLIINGCLFLTTFGILYVTFLMILTKAMRNLSKRILKKNNIK
jgi:O-antigen/teichoic acid export membrane protein